MIDLWRSPTLRSATVMGVSGAGFAGANLILARRLPETEYALFTLFLSVGAVTAIKLAFATRAKNRARELPRPLTTD